MEVLVEYLAKGFLLMLTISMPCVLVAAGIGLVVGILQAVTQVQEQTIAAAPKILGVFLVIVIGGIGFINLLKGFVTDGMAIAFNLVSKNDAYVLPADYYKYTTPFEKEMTDKFKNQPTMNELMKNPGKVPFIDQQQKTKYLPSPRTPMPKPDFVETNKILGR
ncbi:flagellar biosynthetic protein FliQ [Clostridium sp. CAG:967]|jgi:flagellar biosynthesis protein|nr:flagellar biosynthetic protein FliQ [Clostridium sp. CAG:967]CDE87944.1 flagellar biosynthetic protein FliQ [Clostridium sp. CAG:729]